MRTEAQAREVPQAGDLWRAPGALIAIKSDPLRGDESDALFVHCEVHNGASGTLPVPLDERTTGWVFAGTWADTKEWLLSCGFVEVAEGPAWATGRTWEREGVSLSPSGLRWRATYEETHGWGDTPALALAWLRDLLQVEVEEFQAQIQDYTAVIAELKGLL